MDVGCGCIKSWTRPPEWQLQTSRYVPPSHGTHHYALHSDSWQCCCTWRLWLVWSSSERTILTLMKLLLKKVRHSLLLSTIQKRRSVIRRTRSQKQGCHLVLLFQRMLRTRMMPSLGSPHQSPTNGSASHGEVLWSGTR